MGKQFSSIEELEQWIEANQNLGTVNGEPVFSPLRKEFQGGYVTAEIYNRALLIGKTLGYGKTDIGCSAIENFNLSDRQVRGDYAEKVRKIPDEQFTTEFRFYYPVELLTEYTDWYTPIFVPVILWMWCDRHKNLAHEKIVKRARHLGITVEKCNELVYDLWRLESRKKRLVNSKKAGHLVRDRKI